MDGSWFQQGPGSPQGPPGQNLYIPIQPDASSGQIFAPLPYAGGNLFAHGDPSAMHVYPLAYTGLAPQQPYGAQGPAAAFPGQSGPAGYGPGSLDLDWNFYQKLMGVGQAEPGQLQGGSGEASPMQQLAQLQLQQQQLQQQIQQQQQQQQQRQQQQQQQEQLQFLQAQQAMQAMALAESPPTGSGPQKSWAAVLSQPPASSRGSPSTPPPLRGFTAQRSGTGPRAGGSGSAQRQPQPAPLGGGHGGSHPPRRELSPVEPGGPRRSPAAGRSASMPAPLLQHPGPVSSRRPMSPPTGPMTHLADINPAAFETSPAAARFFVIKSYSEDDVHKAIKYGIWASTDVGNRRLDTAHRESAADGPIYLFFSVNASGQFCGCAEMASGVDFATKATVWAQDKWSGQFALKWIFIKDIPNSQFRHIQLANNENKPVTNSRDTQEVPLEPGREMLKIFAGYVPKTSILDDFPFYDKRQARMEERRASSPARAGPGPGPGPVPSASPAASSSSAETASAAATSSTADGPPTAAGSDDPPSPRAPFGNLPPRVAGRGGRP